MLMRNVFKSLSNSIYLVLLMFNDNLFYTNQLWTLLSSVLITLSILLDCIVYTQQLNVVSSAFIIHWEIFTGIRKISISVITKFCI